MDTIQFLAEWALRSSILILSGALLLWVLRVKDPSIRLPAWRAMLCASLAMPLFTAVAPSVPITVMHTARQPFEVRAPIYAAAPEPTYALVAGALSLMSRGLLRGSRATGQATEGVEIRESDRIATPVTMGIALLDFMRRGAPGANWQGVPMARYSRADGRIHRILDGAALSRGVTRWSIAAILALGTPLAYLVAAVQPTPSQSGGSDQAAAPPAFEVASVKPHALPPNSFAFGANGSVIHISGNRVTTRGSLTNLVIAAYNVKEFQVSSARDVADRLGSQQLYDIEAKTEGEGTATLDQVRLMLQRLLADRFQLKLHRETKELPVYDLVVAKNGSKLKESAGDTGPQQPGTFSGLLVRIKYTNRSIADLVGILALNVDRPVLDKTGLTGHYDFTLEFTRNNPDVTPLDSPEADRSIFRAVQDQLGLRLATAREPTAMLVIDHAEKPAEN